MNHMEVFFTILATFMGGCALLAAIAAFGGAIINKRWQTPEQNEHEMDEQAAALTQWRKEKLAREQKRKA